MPIMIRINLRTDRFANQGKGANLPRAFNHRLSVSNGGGLWKSFRIHLVYRLEIACSKEISEERQTTLEHAATCTANPLYSPKTRQDLVRRERFVKCSSRTINPLGVLVN
ncbi:hypothetical protein AVEN_213817-1 [Araneus ventricosus]|uniref:Uncharacterized protein n=1 Tax=Araneus ventricosus TaxID=182803 RepID=A0A4Y2X2W3_ARAVE|nr:hypothetical protein AVEN_166413-1 [Araneus ventricosus]GBO43456.1 hypothetical protein AVEN_213817-1 [Araneus ventricosus]